MLFEVRCRNRATLPEAVCKRLRLEQLPTQPGGAPAFQRLHSIAYMIEIGTLDELVELAREVGDDLMLSGDGMVLHIGREVKRP